MDQKYRSPFSSLNLFLSLSFSLSVSFYSHLFLSLYFSGRESVSAFGNSIIMAFKGKDGEKGKTHTHTYILEETGGNGENFYQLYFLGKGK